MWLSPSIKIWVVYLLVSVVHFVSEFLQSLRLFSVTSEKAIGVSLEKSWSYEGIFKLLQSQ